MGNFKKKLVMVAAISAALAAPTAALATNGYFAAGYGTKTKGLVGAGVALSQDAMAAATNPAGMVMVGNRMDVGMSTFSPSPRSYEASAWNPAGGGMGVNGGMTGDSAESGNDLFYIPHLGYNKMLDSSSSIGVTVYGNGGMNTEYDANDTFGDAGTFGTGTTGVNLAQMFINTTYARKIDDKSSWGASAIVVYQKFSMQGVSAFAGLSNDATKLSDNGTSTSSGFGVKLGIQSEVSPGITVAASYQSEMAMSKFDEYAGLFAEEGDFDIPATWTIGLAWQTSPKSTLVLDVQQIMYSDVASIGGAHDENINACSAAKMGGASTDPQCLGGSNGIGFAWDDMTVIKLGYQWDMSDMTWRVGYSDTDQPIPEDAAMFNIVAPAVIEQHVSFGFTKKLRSKNEINFAFIYALENTLKGTNALSTPAGQTIDLTMKQYEAELSYGMKF